MKQSLRCHVMEMKECFLFLLFMLTNICFGDDFSVVTGVLDVGRGDVLAAFGDFNADKLIDIFVISNSGRNVDILLVQDKKQYMRRTLIANTSLPDQSTIAGIMLADFNGDVLMDVLVTTRKTSQPNSVQISVYWGNGSGIDVDYPYTFHDETFRGEPVLFDFNADMRPDLLTQGTDDLTVVWLADAVAVYKNFTKLNFTKSIDLEVPHSSAFVDLDRNYNADLILTKKNKEFEVFSNNIFNTSTVFSIGKDIEFGQSSFADFNQDGYIDHVVPARKILQGGGFGEHFVYLRDGKEKTQWREVSSPFGSWEFPFNSRSLFNMNFPVTLRVGDYDMDGYPDLLVVLYSQTDQLRPFLLRNVPNDTGDGRQFTIQQSVLPSLPNSTLLATFYDYGEDGMPDILLTALDNGVPYSILLENNLALDTCFLKVTVISGLCADKCPEGRKPYGVNVPGPTVIYETTQANGNPKTSAAGQLSQSAHFALQLPFVNFGLGQTPNFVDTVGVGIPQSAQQLPNKHRTKVWTQIIPNAQLIVNPHPNNEPSYWRMQLFVVPSQKIYLTGIALLSTCIILALIVAVLLWNEKREDKREKKSESQRFHFDAM